MSRHVIVVDRRADFPFPAPGRRVVAAKDFVTEAARELPSSVRVINLCRDYSYLSLGYYSSLLAEARGQKVIPSVEVMLDLHWKRLLRIALPEVNELVARTFQVLPTAQPPFQVMIFFGVPDDSRLTVAARRIFELFRCPLLTIELRYRNGWYVSSIEPAPLSDVRADQQALFADALDRYTRVAWRAPRTSPPVRYSVAILHDPQERLPPSNPKALERFVRVGAQMGLEVELITRSDYGRLLEFDALLIRETTALDHHTYRFAKKAEAEGLAVIDDPQSILRCTNKIFLAELMQANNIPIPRTLIISKNRIGRVERELGFPAVIKIPDGSFSRGVHKVVDATALHTVAEQMFKDTDLIIAQEYMRTPFDWRVGVLDRKPLYVCQYYMARNHWQIVKHRDAAAPIAGDVQTFALDAVPPAVLEVATRAAGLIGNGLYGVDLKQTADGFFVIEINDNPSLDVGVEDAVLKDELYRTILASLVQRIEKRTKPWARVAANGSSSTAEATAVEDSPPIQAENSASYTS